MKFLTAIGVGAVVCASAHAQLRGSIASVVVSDSVMGPMASSQLYPEPDKSIVTETGLTGGTLSASQKAVVLWTLQVQYSGTLSGRPTKLTYSATRNDEADAEAFNDQSGGGASGYGAGDSASASTSVQLGYEVDEDSGAPTNFTGTISNVAWTAVSTNVWSCSITITQSTLTTRAQTKTPLGITMDLFSPPSLPGVRFDPLAKTHPVCDPATAMGETQTWVTLNSIVGS